MSYHLEIWLRGDTKDYLRNISAKNKSDYHPHITLVRPFDISVNDTIDENTIKHTICDFCETKDHIPFKLEGKDSFENKISYIPVTNNENLLNFNNDLEKLLDKYVVFRPRLNSEKILHVTIDFCNEQNSSVNIDLNMLRLTGIKDRRIWFSYDFVTREILNREDTLAQYISY